MGKEHNYTGTLYIDGVEVAEIKEIKAIKSTPAKEENKQNFKFNEVFTGSIEINQKKQLKKIIKNGLLFLEIERLTKILKNTKKYKTKKKLSKRIGKLLSIIF